METIRQGDVLLIPIKRNDPAFVGVTRKSGVPMGRERVHDHDESVVVLAHGEATGHHHHVKSRNVRLRSQRMAGSGNTRRRILHVGHEGATLEHQEHAPIALAPGRYEVVRQTEYVPAPPVPRQRQSSAPAWERSYVFD